jgi:hypothetical protein
MRFVAVFAKRNARGAARPGCISRSELGWRTTLRVADAWLWTPFHVPTVTLFPREYLVGGSAWSTGHHRPSASTLAARRPDVNAPESGAS